jgi:hypothetical protein
MVRTRDIWQGNRSNTALVSVRVQPGDLPEVILTPAISPTQTARSAMAVARAAYVRLAGVVLPRVEDERMKRVAQRAFERGHEILIRLEATASDVALSPEAAEAFDAHLRAIEQADVAAAVSWFDLFPEIMRDVRRGADVRVTALYLPGEQKQAPSVRKSETESEGYRKAGNRQTSLALAA